MKALVENSQQPTERVFLMGAEFRDRRTASLDESMEELSALATSAGGMVVGSGRQRLAAPVASTFIGSGKARQVAEQCVALGVDTVVFDDELTPAQARNLETLFECKILDRTSLILDIFAQRARTREGKLQVELAQMRHLLPRLTRFWSHLSRQKGGIGMRGGEGETQLEVDRRRVQERISRLASELELVRRQRQTQRAGRRRHTWPLASIVGYTNAGKSTLLNALTGSTVEAADKLFATLDPTTRRLTLPTNQPVLLSDTVGFIRKLPHSLVEAFKATLEEVVTADLLLHVVDVSHPEAEQQMEAVHRVLAELEATGKPMVIVLNKVDRLAERSSLAAWLDRCPGAVPVSARTGEGFAELVAETAKYLKPERDLLQLHIPHPAGAVVARAHAVGQILRERHRSDGTQLTVRIPPHLRAEFEPFVRKTAHRSR